MSGNTWAQSALADVTLAWYVGSTPSRKQAEYYSADGMPWVRVEDMTSPLISDTAEKMTVLGIQDSNAKIVPTNAVLVSTAGTIGKVAMAGAELTINQAVQALVINAEIVLPKYVYYYLKFVRPQLESLSNRVTIPHLPKASFQKFPIFFPELEEQRVIVAELDRLEGLSSLKSIVYKRLNDYLPSIFTSCFRDVLAHAHQKRLDMVAELSSGTRARQSNTGEGGPLVNGFGGQLFRLHSTASFVKAIFSKTSEKYQLKQNDILIRKKLSSSPEPCAILVGSLAEPALLGSNLIRVRIFDETILPAYLLAWLILSHRQGNLSALSNYHTDIDIGRAKSIQIPAVPMDNQQLFTRYFDHYLHILTLVNKSNVLLDNLMQSTLEHAFTGKLSYNWRIQNGIPHPLRTVFDIAPVWTEDDEADLYRQNRSQLNASMRAVFASMSAFQQALLERLMRTDKPKAIHELLGELRGETVEFSRPYGIQDAIQTMEVLELLGFVERSDLPLEALGQNPDGGLTAPDGSPIHIQLQILSRDIFKENSDETPKA